MFLVLPFGLFVGVGHVDEGQKRQLVGPQRVAMVRGPLVQRVIEFLRAGLRDKDR